MESCTGLLGCSVTWHLGELFYLGRRMSFVQEPARHRNRTEDEKSPGGTEMTQVHHCVMDETPMLTMTHQVVCQ